MRIQVTIVCLLAVVLVWLIWLRLCAVPAAAAPPEPSSSAAAPEAAALAAAVRAPAEAPAARRELAVPVPAAGDQALGVLLSGTVRDAAGQPIEGASVYLGQGDLNRSTSSGARGAYALTGLSAGTWRIYCRAQGFVPHEAECTLDAQPFPVRDFSLRKTVEVRVKLLQPDGTRLDETLSGMDHDLLPAVVATEAPLAADLPMSEHSAVLGFGVGEWRSAWFSDPTNDVLRKAGYCGTLHLHRDPPVHVALLLRSALITAQRLEAGQRELVFTLTPEQVWGRTATVSLRLLDGDGKPLAGVMLTLQTAQGGGPAGKTGADGCAKVERVAPGLVSLDAHVAVGVESLSRTLRCLPGQQLDLGDIVLASGVKIVGEVVDADGKPIERASLQWTELDSRFPGAPLLTRRSTVVNAGKFELLDCGRHRYVFTVRDASGRSGFAAVDATNGPPSGVRIVLGASTALDLHTTAAPTLGYAVTLSRSVPVAVAHLGGGRARECVTLPEGDYLVEIHDRADDRLVRSFTLPVRGAVQRLEVP